MKNFEEKFRELKVEGLRKKTIKALVIGPESGARRNVEDK